MNPRISTVVAISSKDRAIGNGNKLLWHLPRDMKRFRDITTPHPVIMGRKTFESIPDKHRPLPDRPNIIITRQEDYKVPGTDVVHTLEDAIELAKQYDDQEIFIGGGQQIYELALPIIERLYITVVDSNADGDTFFPEYDHIFTKVIEREEGIDNDFKYTFQILEREDEG